MPQHPDESLASYEARLKATWERDQPKPKQVKDMTDAERAEAWAALSRPAPYCNPVPEDLRGLQVADMDVKQRRRFALAIGLPVPFDDRFL